MIIMALVCLKMHTVAVIRLCNERLVAWKVEWPFAHSARTTVVP